MCDAVLCQGWSRLHERIDSLSIIQDTGTHSVVSLIIEKIKILKLLLFENLYEIKHYKNKTTWYTLFTSTPLFFMIVFTVVLKKKDQKTHRLSLRHIFICMVLLFLLFSR